MSPDRWRKVEELYHAARERDVTLRAVYRHEACAGDDALREEVERWLAAGEKPTGHLEAPILQAAARMFEESPTESLVGRELGVYLVRAKIGEGGMGEVYRAFDTKLRRDVALKVLPKHFARDPERVARFRREAQLLASLNHKNIAAIYGFEELPEANFLVLELVEGETFGERIQSGKQAGRRQEVKESRSQEEAASGIPLQEALTLAGQVTEGLEAAHRKGITHRDIKPANIKVTPEGVMAATGATGAAQFSFSSLGSLAYVPGGSAGQTDLTLVWVDRKGAEQPLPAPPRAYDDPRLSPDGQQVALIEGSTNDVWVYDIPRATLARLTFEGTSDFPLWTPDGKRIVFASAKAGATGLYWKPADGSGPEERLTTSEVKPNLSSVSPDGKTLAFNEARPNTGQDIWVLSLEGTPFIAAASESERKAKPFVQTPFNEIAPMFSPDGRWLAHSSSESSRVEIYVQPFPGPGGKWLISSEGGIAPVWARNGRELFYRNGDKMMVVDITTQPGFRAGTPRMLFERPGYRNDTVRADFDVSPDGQRFLMLKAKEEPQAAAATQIHVVLNWFEELKRRVPVP